MSSTLIHSFRAGLVSLACVLALVGSTATAAPKSTNVHGGLVHVGANPNPFAPGVGCNNTWSGNDGVGNVHVNYAVDRTTLNVSIHGARPNTLYNVNVRCIAILGEFTTNAQGTGNARIELPSAHALPPSFTLEVGHQCGCPVGFAGWDDMYLAGPINLR